MPGTFYTPLPRRRRISGIDHEAPDTTHRNSLESTQIEKKLYIYPLNKLDPLLEDHLAYTFSALVLVDYVRRRNEETIINSEFQFDVDVGMMISRLEKT